MCLGLCLDEVEGKVYNCEAQFNVIDTTIDRHEVILATKWFGVSDSSSKQIEDIIVH